MQGFTDPLHFDPDRFSPERQEDVKFGKNFMAFGSGPHYCVGKEYAINHLTAFLAIISTRHGFFLLPFSLEHILLFTLASRMLQWPTSTLPITWLLHVLIAE